MHDNVNHPVHYQPLFEMKPLECIDITKNMPFIWGNAFKYVWRAGSKGDKAKMIEDLRKADWYLRNAFETYDGSVIPQVIFEQIKTPESDELKRKWEILHLIVYHERVLAVDRIEKWIAELEARHAEKDS